MNQSLKFDAVIIGGGIAGCALACALDKQKMSVLLLEAGELLTPSALDYSVKGFDPRVSALTTASEEFLAELGVWNTIAAQRVSDFDAMHVFDGEGIAEINFCAEDINASHLGHIVENRQIIHALQQRLSFSNNIKIFSGIKITSMVKNQLGYRIECEDHNIIETPLVVGADGGNSFVRQTCGFKTREWDYQHHAIVCTVQTTTSHQKTAWQSFTQFGPLAFLPLPSADSNNDFCSIVWSLEPNEAERIMGLDDSALMHELASSIEYKCGEIKAISRRFSFPLRQRHAVSYVKKSVVLIGDAAHTIHPLAGQGINLGLKDVKALSEEIIRALEGNLPINDQTVLKRYERRRKADNLSMMAVMEGFKRLFGRKDLLAKLLRNRGMQIVSETTPLKKRIIKQAMGL